MRPTLFRQFQSTLRVLGHENPLGLPKSGTPPHWPRKPERRRIRGVERVIAVSSAKGGVGKSTVAANLSLAFARLGYRAGILDTDIFGPSIPTLFNLSGEPRLSQNNQLVPMTNYGVKTMSMGYLVPEDDAVVWRGPMVMKAIQQLLHEVDWGNLDILVLDLPPGTGDTQLTITQQIILDGTSIPFGDISGPHFIHLLPADSQVFMTPGSIIITTPHTLAVKDAVKGVNMFNKVNTNILGLIQNMSLFTCPHCQGETHVFGSNDRVKRMCYDHKIDFLGDIPLHPAIGDDADQGKPTVVSEPTSKRAEIFLKIAKDIAPKIDLRSH